MKTFYFKNWFDVLQQDQALNQKLKQAYPIIIRWYLSYLKREGAVATIDSARSFFEDAIKQHTPKPFIAQRWKDALNWFSAIRVRVAHLGTVPIARSGH